MKQSTINPSEEYKYGFTTDIESIRAPKGLNEEIIHLLSKKKEEPEWFYFHTGTIRCQIDLLKQGSLTDGLFALRTG